MSCDELQAPLAIAIADLEKQKLRLLEVFDWASQPGMIRDDVRARHTMAITLVRVGLPVTDIQLRKALKVLTGSEPPSLEWPK
jgi:hypothetical protein